MDPGGIATFVGEKGGRLVILVQQSFIYVLTLSLLPGSTERGVCNFLQPD